MANYKTQDRSIRKMNALLGPVNPSGRSRKDFFRFNVTGYIQQTNKGKPVTAEILERAVRRAFTKVPHDLQEKQKENLIRILKRKITPRPIPYNKFHTKFMSFVVPSSENIQFELRDPEFLHAYTGKLGNKAKIEVRRILNKYPKVNHEQIDREIASLRDRNLRDNVKEIIEKIFPDRNKPKKDDDKSRFTRKVAEFIKNSDDKPLNQQLQKIISRSPDFTADKIGNFIKRIKNQEVRQRAIAVYHRLFPDATPLALSKNKLLTFLNSIDASTSLKAQFRKFISDQGEAIDPGTISRFAATLPNKEEASRIRGRLLSILKERRDTEKDKAIGRMEKINYAGKNIVMARDTSPNFRTSQKLVQSQDHGIFHEKLLASSENIQWAKAVRRLKKDEKELFNKLDAIHDHFPGLNYKQGEKNGSFFRYTKFSPFWVHIDEMQSDYFRRINNVPEEKDGKKLPPEYSGVVRKFLGSLEFEYFKTSMSALTRRFPQARVFTINSPEVERKVEPGLALKAAHKYYETYPRKMGFKKFNLIKFRSQIIPKLRVKKEVLEKFFKSMGKVSGRDNTADTDDMIHAQYQQGLIDAEERDRRLKGDYSGGKTLFIWVATKKSIFESEEG